MGDHMDSTLMHANKAKAYGRHGKTPMRLNFQHSRLLRLLHRIDTRYQVPPKITIGSFYKENKI